MKIYAIILALATVLKIPSIIAVEKNQSTLTMVYLEQWDNYSGVFKWYRGAIEMASGEKFELIQTYLNPYSFLFEGNEILFYPVENFPDQKILPYPLPKQIWIIQDIKTGAQVQAVPFGKRAFDSYNYGLSEEEEKNRPFDLGPDNDI